MKITTISLATVALLYTHLNAANNFSDLFSEGKISGEIKSYYYDRKSSHMKDRTPVDGSILNLGVKLDYETASLNGFKAAVGFQSVSSPWVNEAGKNAFFWDMHGDGAVLSEANISYTISNSSIKVGRQFIDIPLIKSSDSRFVLQSFEGVTLVNKDIENTTLYGAYIKKFQNRTNGKGDIADFEKLVYKDSSGNSLTSNYSYAFGLKNNSLTGTTLTAAYGELESSHSIYYLEADYKRKHDDLINYGLAVQYSGTNYDEKLKDDANYYGIKLGLGINDFNMYTAYAQVQDGNTQFSATGTGAAKAYIFTNPFHDAGEYEESKQYAIDMNYNFKKINTKFGLRYVDIDYAINDSADWKIAYASHKFSGALKGLSALVVYEEQEHDIRNFRDREELWVRLRYKF